MLIILALKKLKIILFRPADKPAIEKLFPNSTIEFLDAGHW